MNSTRRDFLFLAGTAPLAALTVGGVAEAAVCYDPDTLLPGQKSRRRALGYVDQSPNPPRRCGACVFFTATQPGCGKCALFSGGPVAAAGVCRSFAPRGR
jgi:hypothetical protein